jgi:hypothetical protein
VASSEALDVHYWAMCHASHHCIRMAIEIASNLPLFFDVVDFIFGYNPKVKTMLWAIQIKTKAKCYSFVFYESICIVWVPAVDDGCCLGHHCWRRQAVCKITQVAVELN